MAASGRRRRNRRRGLRSAYTELSPNSHEGRLWMHIKTENREAGSDERKESKNLREWKKIHKMRRRGKREGVKYKTERVSEIRDLRADRRMLLCSHRGVRERRRFYAKLCKLRSSVTRATRAGETHTHTRTHQWKLIPRNKYTHKHTRMRLQRCEDTGVTGSRLLCSCLRYESGGRVK